MELRITNPEENGFLKEIQWNQEEVKSWVAARVQDYKTIAYTADQAKDMKRDRADLNKLRLGKKIIALRASMTMQFPREITIRVLWMM